MKDIDVVVLAGGLGSRLSLVLNDKPKLLAPIGERPYIELLLLWIKKLGARRIIFSLGHLAETIAGYLENNPIEGIEFVVVVEKEPLGTGGAISHVRPKVQSNPVLIMNGDSFIDADLCKFLDFHTYNKSEASILCAEVSDVGRFGAVKLEGNQVVEFQEKNKHFGRGLINAGIYLFGPRVLEEISRGGPSLEDDFFQKQPPGRLFGMSGKFTFLDIGIPEDLAKAPDVLDKYYN